MTREEGLQQIELAKWVKDPEYPQWILEVTDKDGYPVKVYLSLRQAYCDRGHMQILVDGRLNIDHADSFPRYFFSFDEADNHTRLFLKWRLWKERVHPHRLAPNGEDPWA